MKISQFFFFLFTENFQISSLFGQCVWMLQGFVAGKGMIVSLIFGVYSFDLIWSLAFSSCSPVALLIDLLLGNDRQRICFRLIFINFYLWLFIGVYLYIQWNIYIYMCCLEKMWVLSFCILNNLI